ncbi:hypothetical protein BJ166DRAFT_306813 [Pestalotiopsis sp. NC0098]|nr:hypothetical protein BJ166DRAFT_306813 [Pestalotiopsis sp. NC0098]
MRNLISIICGNRIRSTYMGARGVVVSMLGRERISLSSHDGFCTLYPSERPIVPAIPTSVEARRQVSMWTNSLGQAAWYHPDRTPASGFSSFRKVVSDRSAKHEDARVKEACSSPDQDMIALPRLDTFDLERFQTVLSCDFKVGCTRAVVVSATVLIDGDVASNPNLHVAVIDDGDTMLGCQEDWAINRAVLLCTHLELGPDMAAGRSPT